MIATQYTPAPMTSAIPIVGAYYNPLGRQAAFHETSVQRQARKQFTTKHTGLQRTGDWISEQASTSSNSRSLPPSTSTTSSSPSKRISHARSSSVSSYSPTSSNHARELLYAVPEDSDAYQEPHIFYSTGPHPSSTYTVPVSTHQPVPSKSCESYALYLATQIPDFDFSVLAKSTPAVPPPPAVQTKTKPPVPAKPTKIAFSVGHHRRTSSGGDLVSIPEAEE